MEENYKSLASNPVQYDSGELNWKTETMESPIRVFFYDYLKENLVDLSDKKVIDIGSGTGYLTKLYKELGCSKIFGLEPSKTNVVISQKLNPEMNVVENSLEDFDSKIKFDVAVSVMVFEHIAKPEMALEKIYNMLENSGLLFLIIGDKNYLSTQRFGYEVKIQKLENGDFATKTTRPKGILYDILRSVKSYIKYAENSGFELFKNIPLVPSENLQKSEPRYLNFADIPIGHLLIFKK